MEGKRHLLQVDELEFMLSVKHGWLRVPALRPLMADIAQQAAAEALKPIVLKQILKRHVIAYLGSEMRCTDAANHQLLVDGLKSVLSFLSGRRLSWAAFSEMGQSLSCPDGSPSDFLVSLGQLMGMVQPINELFGHAHEASTPTFCSMCWRLVLTGGKYCRVHRVPISGTSESQQLPSRPGTDNYWFGRKLTPLFAEHIRELSIQARKAKLRSSWKESAETRQTIPWLMRYRPLAWQLVVEKMGIPDEALAVPILIQVLDAHDTEGAMLRAQREAFHGTLREDRRAVFDLLLRAEAWLGAASERRSSWGGIRGGAGRPSIASKAKLDKGEAEGW